MMTTKWLKTILLTFLAAILIQCNTVDVPSNSGDNLIPASQDVNNLESPSKTDTPNPGNEAQMNPTDSAPTDPGLQLLIDQAVEDLAARLSIPDDQITLVEAKIVVWPDASLGCPQPGMKYKQVPQDGALIVLQVEGSNYNYHSGGSRGLFLCEQTFKDPNPPPKLDIFNLTPSPDKENSLPPTPDKGIPPGEDL